MKQMLDVICPNSTWGKRLLDLLDAFPQVENHAIAKEHIGIKDNPRKWRLWNE